VSRPAGRWPPTANEAPSSSATATCSKTLSSCVRLISGPIWTSGSAGSPTLTVPAASTSLLTTSS
jgi:hypothetical protein